jgi:hypothetical protein
MESLQRYRYDDSSAARRLYNPPEISMSPQSNIGAITSRGDDNAYSTYALKKDATSVFAELFAAMAGCWALRLPFAILRHTVSQMQYRLLYSISLALFGVYYRELKKAVYIDLKRGFYSADLQMRKPSVSRNVITTTSRRTHPPYVHYL